MCTVTFMPAVDKLYPTSNRDEKLNRKKALPPRSYLHGETSLIYPKDEDAGGSWIAFNENGNTAVLLNGGFKKHISKPPYKKSRELVFLNIIEHTSPVEYFLNVDLSEIEPFTIIMIEQNNLFECVWTSDKKYCKELDLHKPYIWSSATLYDEDVRKKREQWFKQWSDKKTFPDQNDILRFHQFAGDGNKDTNLVMKRGAIYHTVSITSIELTGKNAKMHYCDLQAEENHTLPYRYTFCHISKSV